MYTPKNPTNSMNETATPISSLSPPPAPMWPGRNGDRATSSLYISGVAAMMFGSS